MIVIIYNSEIYKEYLLPEETTSDYTMLLERNTFGLGQDVELAFTGTIDGWKLEEGETYSLRINSEKVKEKLLKDGDIISIVTNGRDMFQAIITNSAFSFPVMRKYDISSEKYISIGKEKNNSIVYDFQNLISSLHATIERHSDGFYISDMSSNGIFYKNRRIRSRKLNFGDCIDIFGLHIVYLDSVLAVGMSYGQADDKLSYLVALDKEQVVRVPSTGYSQATGYFNRSPRNIPEIVEKTMEIDSPPTPKNVKEKPLLLTIGPSFTMAIPMLLGCSMAILSTRLSGNNSSTFMFTGVITAISSAILGVFWALMNLKYSKKEAVEEEEQRFNAYGNYLIKTADELKGLYEHNKRAFYEMYPAASECCNYSENSPKLWNRNYTHEDFLFQRLGTGDIPFQVDIQIPKEKFSLVSDTLSEKPRVIQNEYKLLRDVPVGIDIRKHSLIGLVGGKEKTGAVKLMHLVAAQIAANNSYTDVKMAFIFNRATTKSVNDWECMKWLPHVWSEDKTIRFIAGDETEMGDVLFELTNILRKRSEQAGGLGKKEIVKPYYLLFVQDVALLEGELIRKYIFEPKEEYGLITFLMAEAFEQLPNNCEDIIQDDNYFKGFYNVMQNGEGKQVINFDDISAMQIEQFGRRISGLKVQETQVNADIPTSLDFFEMHQIRSLAEFEVVERWRKNRTYNSMKALVGKKPGNADCYLDIHEKYHGPHGLIAGTTGSGKSETLQTYMLSLAINFSPDDLAFFVIDFKGGGMANLFSDLPHMAGQISNLSGNQVRRAMISIKSENMRRQRIFSEYGVNNINLYTRLYKNHEASIPIPHLIIIIDEFAELKREEPEFMRELISVAQVGRSLGVHLILATQKPSGTVDDSIWSNSKFRLCLRVQDRQDSNDMLHKPDAAFITQAGRCYLQVGNDELYELFQSGYSGAVYYEDDGSNAEAGVSLITTTGKPAVVYNRKRKNSAKAGSDKVKEKTQLEAVVEYLGKVTNDNNYNYRMQLWMPVLPENICLDELKGYKNKTFSNGIYPTHSGKWNLSVNVGLYDDPENQAQNPLEISFSENGHHAVCGTVVSGKSTFLQTVIYAMLMKYSPQYVNIYGLDFSSKMLSPFEKAPHVGGILYENDLEKIGKLFHLIRTFMDERKKLFHGGNYSQYVQVHGVTMPAIVIAIDNYASFKEKTNNIYEDDIIRLSREGVGYGMYLLISSAGFGVTEIPNRIGDNIRTVISLEMGDKFHYMDILRTTSISVLPEKDTKGRGLAYVNGRILEFQTALAVSAEDDFDRSKKLEAQCSVIDEAWTGQKARLIPCIPEKPTLGDIVEAEEYASSIATGDKLPFAYNMENAAVYSMLKQQTYCYGVYGRKRTGKTNVLKLLLHAASLTNGQICVFESDNNELEQQANEAGARYLSTPREYFEYFKELTPIFVERNKEKQMLMKQGLSDEEIYEHMKKFESIYLVISDLEQFINIVYKKNDDILPMNGFLENIIEKGSLHNIYFIAACNLESATTLSAYKLYTCFTNYKTGIILGGNLSAQRIFSFQNISYMELNKNVKKGIGYVPDWEDESIGSKVVVPIAVR